MPRLRVVTGDGERGEVSFAEAAREALERVLAKGAGGLVILWEGESIGWEAVPPLETLAEGLVRRVKRESFTQDTTED